MRRGVRVSGPASDELTDAVRWYETQRPGLGAELFDAVNATIEGIERQPEIGTAAYADPQIRRVLISRFPYQVVYHLAEDQIEEPLVGPSSHRLELQPVVSRIRDYGSA